MDREFDGTCFVWDFNDNKPAGKGPLIRAQDYMANLSLIPSRKCIIMIELIMFGIVVAVAFQNTFAWKCIKIIFFLNLTSAHQSNKKTQKKILWSKRISIFF